MTFEVRERVVVVLATSVVGDLKEEDVVRGAKVERENGREGTDLGQSGGVGLVRKSLQFESVLEESERKDVQRRYVLLRRRPAANKTR